MPVAELVLDLIRSTHYSLAHLLSLRRHQQSCANGQPDNAAGYKPGLRSHSH